MNLCNPKICNCEQGRKIKYTNIDDINTLINEFTSNKNSLTAQALNVEGNITPLIQKKKKRREISERIIIQNAHLHNLNTICCS